MKHREFFTAVKLAAEMPRRFTRRFIRKFFMNAEQVAQLFTNQDDYRILGELNAVYGRSLEENVEEAATIPKALNEYYLKDGRHGRLIIEEAQAGLAYRTDDRLWAAFVALGLEGSLISTSIDDPDEAQKEVENFKRLKAGLDRRASNLDGAEDSLKEQRARLITDLAARTKLAFVEYELGYVFFLKTQISDAIQCFRDSYDHALEGNDPVGAWIGRCVEYTVRAEQGYTTVPAALAVFRAAKTGFLASVDSPTRGKAARRWLMNSILQELELQFRNSDFEATAQLLAEVKRSPAKEGIPDVEGYLDLHEAMVAMLDTTPTHPTAVELLQGVIARKQASGNIAQWYHSEAGAKDLYFLGDAYKRTGDLARAKEAWRDGMKFENSMGNQIWRARCQAELDTMDV